MTVPATPVWMLRINPMVRVRLAQPTLTVLLEAARTLEHDAGPIREAAADDLYRLVPKSPEQLRGRLLAWRRDIHNGRGQPDRLAAETEIDWPASVLRWRDHHGQYRACQARIRRAYDEALATERSSLRERLGEGDFLTTLARSTPGVYDAACRYRAHPTLDAKDRKAERALVQYLTRALVRTSPYGRFTAVGLANPDPAGVALDQVAPATARPHVEVDRPLFDYLAGGLVPPGSSGDPRLALPPTARLDGDRVTFFQVREATVRQLSTPLTPRTRLLVELLDLGPLPRGALASAMADGLGIELPAAERMLDVALGLGLLVTMWRGDEFVADPVAQAGRDRAGTDSEPAGRDPVTEALDRFGAHLDRLGDPATPPNERIAVSRQLEAASDHLSLLAGRPAQLTVHEDYVLAPLLVDPGAHRGALDDLAAVAELLAAFDRMHVVRALLAAEVESRFGAGCRVPLVAHAEALVRAVYRTERTLARDPAAALGPSDGSLAMLAKIQREALTALHRSLGGPDEARWSPEDARALVADIPDRFRAAAASYGLVVQPVGPDLVVNDAYAGHGPMVSRFLQASHQRGDDAAARLASRLGWLFGPDGLVEDGGWHNLGINAHPPVLERRLRPDEWRHLALVHDPVTESVSIADRDGAPIKVLALGAQLPEQFPYPVRLATWLVSSGRVVLDVIGALHRSGRDGATKTTTGYPRLRVGGVVMARRRWYLGADFPTPGRHDAGVEYLLALTEWRARHEVPAEVMLKSLFAGPTDWEDLNDPGSRTQFFELRNRAKPQYVDLASTLMTRVLPRLLERRPSGCIEEALPGLADGGHAREWMIEYARPAGQRGFDWRR